MKAPPPDVVRARMQAWAELVDLGVEMMLAVQRQHRLERDPWEFVRTALRRQADDSSRANLRIARGLAGYGK